MVALPSPSRSAQGGSSPSVTELPVVVDSSGSGVVVGAPVGSGVAVLPGASVVSGAAEVCTVVPVVAGAPVVGGSDVATDTVVTASVVAVVPSSELQEPIVSAAITRASTRDL